VNDRSHHKLLHSKVACQPPHPRGKKSFVRDYKLLPAWNFAAGQKADGL